MHSERGQILILAALSMVGLLGVAALSIDGGFMFDQRNRLSQAADYAAKSGAIEYRRNHSVLPSELEAFADRAFLSHGMTSTRLGGNTTVTVIHPPDDGPYEDLDDYVEINAERPYGTFFGAVLGFASVTPRVRAVAGAGASSQCMVVLRDPDDDPAGDVTLDLNPSLVMGPTCDIAVGGDISIPNDANIQAAHVSAASCDNCSGPDYSVATIPPSDPLEGLREPTPAECNNGNPGTDLTLPQNSGPVTITPGTYHDITFGSGPLPDQLVLDPGIYCITGEISATNPGQYVTIDGSAGVMVYIAETGAFNLNSNQVLVTLEGIEGGDFNGVAFYQDRDNHTTIELGKNDSTYNLNGAFYAPSATLVGKNSNWATTNFCGLIVAGGMEINKPNMIMDTSCYDYGTIFQTVSLAE